jgi:hypothetical protein
VNFVVPADELSLIGIPHGFSADGPIFTAGHRFIAKVNWTPDQAPATLSLRTPLGSESSSAWPTHESPAYLVFSVRDVGTTTLTANFDRQGSLNIETAAGPTSDEVRKKLNATQALQILIGDTPIRAWQELVSLRPAPGEADPYQIVISPEYEALRFDMQSTTADGVKYDCGLTAQMVQDRLAASWGREADFQISAGALGSIRLRFLPPNRSRSTPRVSRAMRWAALAGGRPQPVTSSWMRRRLAANKIGPLRGTTGGSSARWFPLIVNELKRRRSERSGLGYWA